MQHHELPPIKMTPEEIADAQERRAVVQHEKWMETCAAYLRSLVDARAAQAVSTDQYERMVKTLEAQTRTGQGIAAEMPRSQRLSILVDSATERVTDRATPTGVADIPKAVAEALAILMQSEAMLAPPPPPAPPPLPPPIDPPKPPGA